MVGIYWVSTVPASPLLNQNFYISVSTAGSYTGAFCSVASVVAPVVATGGSYAAFYRAGSVPVGTYAIYLYVVKGTDGSFSNDHSITIQTSDIADVAKTVYTILRSNIGASYASCVISTGWYSTNARYPMVTVTSASRDDVTYNLFDTFRKHEEMVNIDTWVSQRAFGVGQKNAATLLDQEVKRIVNANRKAPSTKLRHMQIIKSDAIPEVTDNRRIFRTRHSTRVRWDESIS